MKSRKFVGSEGRDQAKLSDVASSRRGMHRRPLVWLLASAMAVFGTADGFSSERLKSASPSSAGRHKLASSSRKSTESEHPTALKQRHRVIEQPAAGDSAEALPPADLDAAKQAALLVRRGKAKDATAIAASVGDP